MSIKEVIILNNKGFAITGILYTLFILFLLILVSVLGALSARKNMLEASTGKLEESYLGSDSGSADNILLFKNNKRTPVTGRYEFNFFNAGSSYTCYAYLKSGIAYTELKNDVRNFVFTTVDCNDYKDKMYDVELVEVISFEEEG